MFKNYLKITVRSLAKDWVYAGINFFGLIAGLVAVVLIMAYVEYEFSYDKHYSNSSKIFRLVVTQKTEAEYETSTFAPDQLANTLKQEFPEIKAATILNKVNKDFLVDNRIFSIQAIVVDSSFLNMFNLRVISGNANHLTAENSIVLTKSLASRLYGERNPIGAIVYNDARDVAYTVIAIIEDIPENTHFAAQALIYSRSKTWPLWDGHRVQSAYIMLSDVSDGSKLADKFSKVYTKLHFPDNTTLTLQPVTSIHLFSNFADEPFGNNSIKNVYIILIIAGLILIVACVNYINLTAARSLKRLKEVGIRKMLGANIRSLSAQFIIEATAFFLLCLPFTFLISVLLWPQFTRIIGISANISYILNIKFILWSLLICICSGTLSGLYPAFVLSKSNALDILKNQQGKLFVNINLRKVLIVFQFIVSISLVVATVVIYKQLHLLNNMELGFNKENLITLPRLYYKNYAQPFKEELRKNSNVLNATIAFWDIGDSYGGYSTMSDPSDSTKNWNFTFLDVDFDFQSTMQAKLTEGRFFSTQYGTDMVDVDSIAELAAKNKKLSGTEWVDIISQRPIVITSKTAELLKLKKPVVGTVLKYGALQGTIIGVLNEFQGVSLLKKTPMVVIKATQVNNWGNAYIRISPKDRLGTITYIEKVWKKFFPDRVFAFSFVDDKLQQLYTSQQRLAVIFNSFAILAVVIALLGLVSIVSMICVQRTKEVGIRKVLGASTTRIIYLMSSDFLMLILIAICIGCPLSWWAMHNWLEDFQYRVTINLWIFPAAGIVMIILSISILSIIISKATNTKLVDSLRIE